MMKRILSTAALIIAGFTFSTLVQAEESFLPSSFKANFTQIITSVVTGKNKESQGAIEYLYPGKIRFEVKSPSQSLYVCDGKKIWYYTAPFIQGEKGQVSIKSAEKNNLISNFFDALKNGLKNNKLYTVKKEALVSYLSFSASSTKELGIARASLFFKSANAEKLSNLDHMLIEYNDKRKVTLKFSAFESGIAFKDDHFIFKIPEGTNITE